MEKFQRNYKIEFEIGHRTDDFQYIPEQVLEISYPITLRLETSYSPFSQANVGKFQLYNLSAHTQNLLHKDFYDQRKYVRMKLMAGYQEVMPVIFYGDFTQCYSTRQSGSVDFITSIEANDLQYVLLRGFTNTTFSENTTPENLLLTLTSEIPNLKIGYISKEIKTLQSDQTFLGNSIDLIREEYPDLQIFINQDELNILADYEVLPGDIQVITSRSGLLGSPTRAEGYFVLDTLFEPGIKIGQQVSVISQTTPYMNNAYKVVGVKHSGVISPVESGKLKTQLTLFMGQYPFEELKKATSTYGQIQTNGQFIKPVEGARVSSPFGKREKPKEGASTNHQGIDYAIKAGTPIKATANGIATLVGVKGGYGNTVMLNHGKINNINIVSLYGHMSKFNINVNDRVSAGQVIGFVGSTGVSTGPHCHFEIRENGKAVNPCKYIGS